MFNFKPPRNISLKSKIFFCWVSRTSTLQYPSPGLGLGTGLEFGEARARSPLRPAVRPGRAWASSGLTRPGFGLEARPSTSLSKGVYSIPYETSEYPDGLPIFGNMDIRRD